MIGIELAGVDFGYRRSAPLLVDFCATFDTARVHAVVGPSGSGKSTALYVAGLMLRPQRGEVRLLGTDWARATDAERARVRERHIGFVFQDALLDHALTVAENIAEGFPWHRGRSRCAGSSQDHLERLGLASLAGRRAAALSGGQAQRVALVRALAKQPAIVLADEPTGNLDPVSSDVVFNELSTYTQDHDAVCIVVTHDPAIAARCDTITELAAAT